jgi:Fe(3+) dicitrate transport protein
MKYLIVLISFFIISISLSLGQTGVIEGVISQSDTLNSIPGVSVYLEKTSLGAATNGNGFFRISKVPQGEYTLVVSAIGYTAQKQNVKVEEGTTLTLNYSVEESISTLSEVTVMTGGIKGLKEIPGSVQYISPKELAKFSYTDVNRTLRSVPGVNVQEEDGFGLRPNIGLRGTGAERSSKITVMEDGVLMAPAPYAAPAAYYFPTIGRMQGIEILKGASQIKYGPYTTGGAINLISTQIPANFAGKIDLMAGSFGGRNLHATVGNSHRHFGYIVETFQYGSNGFKKLDGGGNTGFDKQDYLAKIRVNTKAEAKVYQSLTFKVGHTRENSNETYLGLTQEDFDTTPNRRYAASQKDEMTTTQWQLSLTHILRLSKLFDVTTTAYRSEFARNWYKLDKVRDSTGTKSSIGSILDDPTAYDDAYDILKGQTSTNSDALFVKANNREYYAQGVQTVLGFNFETGKVKHDIDLGFRIHQDQIDRFQWIDEYAMDNGVMMLTEAGEHGTESNRVETANAIASYLQYKLKFWNFTITPGVRFEQINIDRKDYGKEDPTRTGVDLSERSNNTNVFIPGIGIDYQFSRYFSVFGGVHKGFAPPGSKEETEPEESINYELGTRYTKNALSGELVLFFNDYSNLLGADLAASGGGGSTDLYNGGQVQAKGIEFQISYDLLSSWKNTRFRLPLSANYTYTDAHFKNGFESDFEGWGAVEDGDAFPYLANHQFTIGLGLEHRKFSINLSGRYMGEMRTAPGQGAIPANEKTDSYFVLDASASYAVHKYISFFGNITNISNDAYVVARRPAGLRPGMPRAFNLGVKASF